MSPEQIELLKNPTLEGALKLWPHTVLGPPASPAGLHKARLLWKDATPEMRAESRVWLLEQGYKVPEGR